MTEPLPTNRSLAVPSCAKLTLLDFKVHFELRYVQWERARFGGPSEDSNTQRARRKRWLKEEN